MLTEDEMVGWHHRLNGLEFEQALGVGDGQGSLACCSPWVTKSQTLLSDWTELSILCCAGFVFFFFFSLQECKENIPVAIGFLKIGCFWN